MKGRLAVAVLIAISTIFDVLLCHVAEGQLLNRSEGADIPFASGALPGRTFLMNDVEGYQNYGYTGYRNYDTMLFPYTTERRNFYDPFGSFLIRGFDVFQWVESRTLAPQPGSFIWKMHQSLHL